MFCLKLTKDKKGVALFIVLAAMATLAIFVGEITYTAQINQKLAYDRLDQVKAQSLAKSGLRLALLRIKAYTEIKKFVSKTAKDTGVSSDLVNAMVPKAIIEKIWSEPITVPFSGDISSLPSGVKDALVKFRKDSSMEGKLYLSIQAQSSKFNLNSTLPAFAALNSTGTATATGTSTNTSTSVDTTTGTGGANAAAFNPDQARQLLTQQLKDTFQKKFEDDEKFRDNYRNFRVEDLAEDIIGWSDLSFESQRESSATIPFKKAPFYHVSELHYLQSMDDDLYDLLSDQFSAGVASFINVNSIKEAVLKALVPQMTTEETKKFFEFRDSTGEQEGKSKQGGQSEDNSFKSADDFFKYLKEKVQFFAGSDQKINDFKNALTQRGIQISTDENNFLVHVEATVQQTKRTLEAMVSIVPASTPPPTGVNPSNPNAPLNNNPGAPTVEKSNLKITQLRFL